MIKVSHLKPSGNYMYHNLQHYESLQFAKQSICVFIIVWKSIQIIRLNSTDWLVCIRSTRKMFSEVSCVIQKHVCPHIKYIYIYIYIHTHIYLTKTKRARHWTDTFCLWRRCLVRQDENIVAEHQDSQTVSCRVTLTQRSFQRVNWWLKLNLLWPSQVHQFSVNYEVLMVH